MKRIRYFCCALAVIITAGVNATDARAGPDTAKDYTASDEEIAYKSEYAAYSYSDKDFASGTAEPAIVYGGGDPPAYPSPGAGAASQYGGKNSPVVEINQSGAQTESDKSSYGNADGGPVITNDSGVKTAEVSGDDQKVSNAVANQVGPYILWPCLSVTAVAAGTFAVYNSILTAKRMDKTGK